MKISFLFSLFCFLQCSEPQSHQPFNEKTTAQSVNTSPEEPKAMKVNEETDGLQNQGSPERTFAKKYPNATKVSWGKDKHGYYEASFEMNGQKYRADFTDTGVWVQTESSVKFDELPQKVKNAIQADFDKGDIVEIEKVEHPTKGTFYDVEFDKKKGKVDIEINAKGVIIGKDSSN
jgi:hypothetical protein